MYIYQNVYSGNTVLYVTINEKFLSLSPPPWQHYQNQFLLSEVSQQPKGAEWLWHPKVVVLYKLVLQNSESNSTSREAVIGALQNITAGEARVGSHTKYYACIFIFQNELSDLFFGCFGIGFFDKKTNNSTQSTEQNL